MLPDINCDMGEGLGNEEALMPLIGSANIACGFHAGSGDLIRKTIDLALKCGVRIGAHPSFRDKANFGRAEMRLSHDKLYALIMEQLIRIDLIAKEKGAHLHHIKPHGALYNMAARDRDTAHTIALAVKDFREDLVLFGLSGSVMINVAEELGLKTASEVFADRLYADDGSLVPRSEPGALIEDPEAAAVQAILLATEGVVITVSGNRLPLKTDTVCIHGDAPAAIPLARALYTNFKGRLQES